MIFIGIDNGVSGSIGIVPSVDEKEVAPMYVKMPTKKQLSYTKTAQNITRIDIRALFCILRKYDPKNVILAMERPMINPGRFKATVSAIRALEATLITIEQLNFNYRYIDSKEWQKAMLPHDIEGDELKESSLEVGTQLFPNVSFGKLKDADGLLIAEYLRRTYEQRF
jgi:hypothetical protein